MALPWLLRYIFLAFFLSISDGRTFQMTSDHCNLQHGLKGCRCHNYNGTQLHGTWLVQCCCANVDKVPQNLTRHLESLALTKVTLEEIRAVDFLRYPLLKNVDILDAVLLRKINAKAFSHLQHLKRLSIRHCPKLVTMEGTFLQYNPHIRVLRLQDTALTAIPRLKKHPKSKGHPQISLSDNRFQTIETGQFENISASSVDLTHNHIRTIQAGAFPHSIIGKLTLKMNPLKFIDPNAFQNLTVLKIDLSETKIQNLPVDGLGDLQVLKVERTPSLKRLPSILAFKRLKQAKLTYPYHCCLFKHINLAAKTPDTLKYAANIEELRETYCVKPSPASATNNTSTKTWDNVESVRNARDTKNSGDGRSWGGFGKWHLDGPKKSSMKASRTAPPKTEQKTGLHSNQTWLNALDYSAYDSIEDEDDEDEDEDEDTWKWFVEPVPLTDDQIVITDKACKNDDLTGVYDFFSHVKCTPQPDPLNPCEDVMGFSFLRVIIWIVWLLAITGNLTVLVVLWMTHHPRMRVHHFLMMNLAFADLCAGIYLGMLAVQDILTQGRYYNFAVDWQTGFGCKLAGFLSVFASELSIVTMFLISFDAWYNTKYVFYGRRLRLIEAAIGIGLGWIFSVIMGILPLVGINSYSVTSTCLPLDITSTYDKGYVMFGLIFNVAVFAAITASYYGIYRMVSGSAGTGTGPEDIQIAKKMAILISTDFICWAPTIFFGLTAAASAPLISISIAKIFLVVFYPINSMANPFLYVFFTKMFRKDMGRLLRKHPWLQRLAASPSHFYFKSHNYYYHSNPARKSSGVTILSSAGSKRNSRSSTCSASSRNGSFTSGTRISEPSLSLPASPSLHLEVPPEPRIHMPRSESGQTSVLFKKVAFKKPEEDHIPSAPDSVCSVEQAMEAPMKTGLAAMLGKKPQPLRLKFQPRMSDISENSYSHSSSNSMTDEHAEPNQKQTAEEYNSDQLLTPEDEGAHQSYNAASFLLSDNMLHPLYEEDCALLESETNGERFSLESSERLFDKKDSVTNSEDSGTELKDIVDGSEEQDSVNNDALDCCEQNDGELASFCPSDLITPLDKIRIRRRSSDLNSTESGYYSSVAASPDVISPSSNGRWFKMTSHKPKPSKLVCNENAADGVTEHTSCL